MARHPSHKCPPLARLSLVLANTLFYAEVDELLSIVDRLGLLMEEARIPYELVGGMAVFLHVRAVSEENARLTNDVDVAIRRADLDTLKECAPNHGFEYRHAAGIDMLIDAEKRTAKGAIHFVFAGEKVRQDYVAPVPEITNPPFAEGIRIASSPRRSEPRCHPRSMIASTTPKAASNKFPC